MLLLPGHSQRGGILALLRALFDFSALYFMYVFYIDYIGNLLL